MNSESVDTEAWLQSAYELNDRLTEWNYLVWIWVSPDRHTYRSRVMTFQDRSSDDASFEELVHEVMMNSDYTLPGFWLAMVPDSLLDREVHPGGEFPTLYLDNLTVVIADQDPWAGWDLTSFNNRK